MNAVPMIISNLLLALFVLTPSTKGAEKLPARSPVLTSKDVLDNTHKITPGDTLWIEIVSDKRRQFAEVVSAKGVLEVPGLAQMKAAGITPKNLAFEMKSRLEAAGVSVASILVSYQRIYPPKPDKTNDPSIIVFGFVGKQGRYKLTDDQEITVSGLVRRAGGINSLKKTPRIIINRKTPQGYKRILVNTKAILNEKNKSYDLFLRQDDVVIVE